jgi:glycosyltransferase involved in cell wall biosynthesis
LTNPPFCLKLALMKLIVMIPCYNEEETLPLVLKSIPQKIDGIDKIETLIIDDGSTDQTVKVARKHEVDHIVFHKRNLGLARAFESGLNRALELGADIIVNTDGDNQYPQKDIPGLIKPILEGKADIVIGNRQTEKIKHFSSVRRFSQRLASSTVRRLSHTNVPDVLSGFRAFSKEAALKLNILTGFSYVTDTILQARKKGLTVVSIPIKTNPKTRKSRLAKNLWQHAKETAGSVIRTYTVYQPLKVFSFLGLAIFFLGALGGLRFTYYFLQGRGTGHIQSLILSAVLLIIGFQILVLGLVADLIAMNRKLIEDINYKLKKHLYSQESDQEEKT